ncbi:hypothetical protein PO909_001880, partial [Leuciscus waleckii]
ICQHFYLPREFTAFFVTAVYIPPSANASVAVDILQTSVNKLQSTHPDGIFIVAGDFNHSLEGYTCTVLHYIKTCIDNVTVERQVKCYKNNKPWMNREVKLLLKKRDKAFRAGDIQLYSTARSKLKTGIKEAKAAYRRKIEEHFNEGDPRCVWLGIQHLTNFKGSKDPSPSTSSNLAEELNYFFARFEVNGTRTESTSATPITLLPTDALTFSLSAEEVRRAFLGVNPRKAAGPDGIPGRVLRDCADQLAEVFTSIFNISLSTCSIPKCLKSTIIVPILKKSAVSSFNDYRPVALTSTVMKYFERLLLNHIKASLPSTLDQHQFAYKANR